MKKILLTLCCAFLCFCGCDNITNAKIGICMPNLTNQRWQQDGSNLEKELRAKGYKTQLKFADDKTVTQLNQINDLIEDGCKCLVIAPINGSALRTALDKAKERNVKVIAYDRLLMNSDAITAYITFDSVKAGKMIASHIESKLNLKTTKGPYYIEIFSGDINDSNSKLVYDGAMSVLQPYIDKKILRVKSSQISLQETNTSKWSPDSARERMQMLLKKYYVYNEPLHAVLAASDSIAAGVSQALVNAKLPQFPIVTGQDADISAIQRIQKGEQSCTIFKDTRVLAKEAAFLVDKVMRRKANLSDVTKFNNGSVNVPSYLSSPVLVDKYNYKSLLIDSGYYTKQQLGR